MDAVGQLEGRETPIGEEAADLRQGRRLVVATRYDHRADQLAECGVGQSDDGGVRDRGMSEQMFFDVVGGHVLTRTHDRVFDPSGHRQVTGRKPADQIAGGVETVIGEAPHIVFGGPVVAADRVRAADLQLAFGPVGHGAAVLVDDADLVERAHR